MRCEKGEIKKIKALCSWSKLPLKAALLCNLYVMKTLVVSQKQWSSIPLKTSTDSQFRALATNTNIFK